MIEEGDYITMSVEARRTFWQRLIRQKPKIVRELYKVTADYEMTHMGEVTELEEKAFMSINKLIGKMKREKH